MRNSLLIDELLNDGTSEEFASKILCDARELMEEDEDEDEEKVKTQTDEEEQKEERALVHTNTKTGNLITLREISALLTPIHRELNELRSEVTKLKNDIITLKNKKEEKISNEETTETEHENKFFPLSVPPITYETFKSSSFSTSSIECEERNGEISLLSEVDRMLSSVRRRCT